MKQNNVPDVAPEGPQVQAETWFALAIAAFAVTAVIFATVGLWIFTDDPDKTLSRAQAFTPFGAALIAVVTFFTIAWRGVLNTRQLEYQADQIAQARRQNDAKDDENLAKLLQEGAKLVGESEKQSHVLAGIATLSVLLQDPMKRFGEQAMDILADFVADAHTNEALDIAFTAAARALSNGADRSLTSSTALNLRRSSSDRRQWLPIRGVAEVRYFGGLVRHSSLSEFMNGAPQCSFQDTRFEYCQIDRDEWMQGCTFVNCHIIKLDGDSIGTCIFERCDFSEADISGSIFGGKVFSEKSADNYYYDGRPPRSVDFDWQSQLTKKPSRDQKPF